MATARRNRSLYKAKAMKSTNAFSIFDQSQIQEFKEAFNLIGLLNSKLSFKLIFLFHMIFTRSK